MLYYCLENDAVCAVLEYLPNAPSSMVVVEVSEDQKQKIDAKTHWFDPKTRTVRAFTKQELQEIEKENTATNRTGTYTISLHDKYTPSWAENEVEFRCEQTQNGTNLCVINNTGFDIVATGSTDGGNFSEVLVQSGNKYYSKANRVPQIGILVFRASN